MWGRSCEETMRDMGWERVACGSLEGVAGERGHKIAARQGRGGLNCNVCSGLLHCTTVTAYSLSLQNISNKTGRKRSQTSASPYRRRGVLYCKIKRRDRTTRDRRGVSTVFRVECGPNPNGAGKANVRPHCINLLASTATPFMYHRRLGDEIFYITVTPYCDHTALYSTNLDCPPTSIICSRSAKKLFL